jgi:heme-degrading monooxygenase HmoA
MMTVVTRAVLKEGSEPEWDSAMRDRLASARNQEGWIAGQLLIPLDGLNERVIIGTWNTRADWEAWHEKPEFAETRKRLDGLQEAPAKTVWHEVVIDTRKEATA